jgi:hypothetical protein
VETSDTAHQVHFDLGTTSVAAGGSPGPSGQQQASEDPFLSPLTPQDSHQVSIYFIKFIIYILTNQFQGGISSPPSENFDLTVGSGPRSDNSQGEDSDSDALGPATDPSTLTRRGQKAGSRLTGLNDDILRFFHCDDEGRRMCQFCL